MLSLVCEPVSYDVMYVLCFYQCSGRTFSPLLEVVVMQWCQKSQFSAMNRAK